MRSLRQYVCLMAVSCAAFAARSATVQYETVGGVRWAYTITDGEATIGTGGMTPAVDVATSGALRVPAEIGGAQVVALDRWCFYQCPNITSVEVPDGVRSLGYLCFGHCTALESVRLPAGLPATPDSLFKGCTALKSAEIPQSVTTFGRDCFWGCTSLTNAVLPMGITVLPTMTFYKCESLAEIALPPNLTELGVSSFSWCTGLGSIDIPDSVSVIGSSAFEKCESLTELKLPSALTYIDGIVGRCTGLKSFTIPRGVVTIADGALSGLTGLDRFDVEEGNGVFRSLDGILCEGDKLIAWPRKKTPVVIPDGIREIGASVFQNNLDLTDIVIPESVGVIGARAFSNCTELRSVTIRHPNVTIGDYAFFGDFRLTSFVLAGRAGSVGGNAFLRCTGLRIPSWATSLPVDLNEWREGHPEELAEWSFEKIPGPYDWRSPAYFGLVGDENDAMIRREYATPVGYTNSAYVDVDAIKDVRFPFEADLHTKDVSISFRARLHPMEEPPPVIEPPLPDMPGLFAIRIRQGFEVGVRGRFKLFTVVDDPENPADVRLGIVSDRVYLTAFSPVWTRNGSNMPMVDWSDFVVQMDEEGFTVTCNEKVICSGTTEKFPYPDAAADTRLNGLTVLGYGQIDEVKAETVQVRAQVDLPREMVWGPDPCVPEVLVRDPLSGILQKGVEYTVDITDNGMPGTARVMVTGIGFYAGTIEKTFEVVSTAETPEEYRKVFDWLNEKGISTEGGVSQTLSSRTGKKTSSGELLSVWDEYVQGTDPTDPDDRFVVDIEIVDGKPVVSFTPDLGDRRKYTLLGSADLKTWRVAEDGDGSRYFKAKVEMK